MGFPRDVVVVGGCGHAGLPLGLAFAQRGLNVVLYDIDAAAVASVNAGRMPFDEPGAPEVLAEVDAAGQLSASTDPVCISDAEHVVVVIGTPVDEHLNPDPGAVLAAVGDLHRHLRDGQLIVLRSTVYPGVTAMVEKLVQDAGRTIDVAFCPERIAEGKAMTELFTLPQIVGGRSARAAQRAEALFRVLVEEIVQLSPEEAELAKLFTNAWRYLRFAAANQLYMMANDHGIDFERVRHGLVHEYPRAADMPGAGFAAGPCLLKDTMQLAAFNDNKFHLGHAAMQVNEGLPLYIVSRLEARHDLATMTVGILGMAFKGDSDDIRSSLAYKLKRILRFKAAAVLCTDPFVAGSTDPQLLPLADVLERADLLIVGAPHRAYAALRPTQPVADIWNVLGAGVRV